MNTKPKKPAAFALKETAPLVITATQRRTANDMCLTNTLFSVYASEDGSQMQIQSVYGNTYHNYVAGCDRRTCTVRIPERYQNNDLVENIEFEDDEEVGPTFFIEDPDLAALLYVLLDATRDALVFNLQLDLQIPETSGLIRVEAQPEEGIMILNITHDVHGQLLMELTAPVAWSRFQQNQTL